MPPKFRGGRGGHGGTFKHGFATRKRSSPGGDNDTPKVSKKAKAEEGEEEDGVAVVPELKTDDDGNQYIGLNASGKRRVTVSDFNKNTLVSIREYWVNDSGELKPGKKGISLTVDQYNTLLAAAPLIEAALAKKDIQVVRPDYDNDVNTKTQASKEADGDGEGGEEEEEAVQKVDDDEEEEEG